MMFLLLPPIRAEETTAGCCALPETRDRTKVDKSQKLFGKKIVNIVTFKMATSLCWSDSICDDIYRVDHQSLVIQLFSINNCFDGLLAIIIKVTKLWRWWSYQPPLVNSTVVMIAMIIVSSTLSSHQITKCFFFFQNCDNDYFSHLWWAQLWRTGQLGLRRRLARSEPLQSSSSSSLSCQSLLVLQ